MTRLDTTCSLHMHFEIFRYAKQELDAEARRFLISYGGFETRARRIGLLTVQVVRRQYCLVISAPDPMDSLPDDLCNHDFEDRGFTFVRSMSTEPLRVLTPFFPQTEPTPYLLARLMKIHFGHLSQIASTISIQPHELSAPPSPHPDAETGEERSRLCLLYAVAACYRY